MPRLPRGKLDAGLYHVYTRSPGKVPFYHDDVDRTDFCNRLSACVAAERVRCLAFALLTTHYHLIVEVGTDCLQPAMKWLNGTYAQRFNKRHARWGHLCGSRYSAVAIHSERQLRRAFRYVALNPVRAGLCALPQAWQWSSYAGTAGHSPVVFRFVDDSQLVEHFGAQDPERRHLRAFVEQALTKL